MTDLRYSYRDKVLGKKGKTFYVHSMAYGQEETVLSDRKWNQSLYLPLVLSLQPHPVSLDLDELVSSNGGSVP